MGIKTGKPFSVLSSLLWTPGNGFFLLARHLQRMAHSAAYFSFAFSPSVIREHLEYLTVDLTTPHKVRITSNREGQPAGEALPLILTDRPVPVALAVEPVDPANPFLYHKTTNRQVYEQALASRPGHTDAVQDVILWNTRGEITESTIANVVVKINGNLYTPPVSCGLLPGVFRAHLLAEGVIQEKVISITAFQTVQEVFLVNSVRQWRRCIVVSEP